ncbi:MAG: hypothetical protein L6V93_10355 [Clostridiales bacterium]|nr:MAG: hypothetical protein L6V93_10355 [Clostridiales bacterium]
MRVPLIFLSGEKFKKIKWVNDIFVKGKKVCGILTEASTAVEEGRLDYAVFGYRSQCLRTERRIS